MKNNVGLKRIASELGVSLTTVSRALSDAPDIGEKTKAKVRQKAIELKYTPNVFAKSLSTGKSNIIAVIVDSLTSPYFSFVLDLVAREIKKRGYLLSLYPTDHAYTEKQDVKTLIGIGAAAILTFTIPHRDAVETAALSSRPILLFGRGSAEPNLNVFYTDDSRGGYLAAEYLHRKGHAKLAYLQGDVVEVSAYRYSGFAKYCTEHGLEEHLVPSNEVDASFPALLESGFTGVFAFDDQACARFLYRFHDPRIDIIAFNGLQQTEMMPFGYRGFPSLAPNYGEMVQQCVDTLIRQIESPEEKPIQKRFDVQIMSGEKQ